MAGLLEAAPDAMVCVDSDGRIVLVNAQAERLFGYPREELAGQLVEMLVPDASKAGYRALRAGYTADPRPRAWPQAWPPPSGPVSCDLPYGDRHTWREMTGRAARGSREVPM